MDSLKIKAILASVRLGSFSAAAEEFSYTPSAFSHMMTSLEGELGVKIFNRSRNGVSLTNEGKLLLPRFEAFLAAEGEILDTCARLGKKMNHTLRIGAYSSIMRNYLSKILSSFRKKFPNIDLFVNVVDNLEGYIEEGKADIIFADEGFLAGNCGGVFAKDDYCVIAPKDFSWDKPEITREELYSYPHILICDSKITTYLDSDRFTHLIHLSTEDDMSVFKMVQDGMGLAVTSRLIAEENTDVVKNLALTPPLRRDLCYITSKASRRSFALREFIAHLKASRGELS